MRTNRRDFLRGMLASAFGAFLTWARAVKAEEAEPQPIVLTADEKREAVECAAASEAEKAIGQMRVPADLTDGTTSIWYDGVWDGEAMAVRFSREWDGNWSTRYVVGWDGRAAGPPVNGDMRELWRITDTRWFCAWNNGDRTWIDWVDGEWQESPVEDMPPQILAAMRTRGYPTIMTYGADLG